MPWHGGCVSSSKTDASLIEPLPMVRCKKCQFIFNGVIMPKEKFEELYEGDYVSSVISPHEDSLSADERRLVDDICAFAGRPGAVFEIGCYDGRLLLEFQKRGWKVKGCELCGAAAVAERRLNVAISRKSFSKESFGGELFDAIYCRYVLEHVADPVSFLCEMASGLNPDGFVAIEVPDVQSRLIDGVLGIVAHEHIGYFVPASLADVFVRAQLTPFSIRTGRQGLVMFGSRKGESMNGYEIDVTANTAELIRRWSTLREDKKKRLRDLLDGISSGRRCRVLIVGADYHTLEFLADGWVDESNELILSDDDPCKIGKFFIGTDKVIHSVADGMAGRPDVVIISTYSSSKKIAEKIIGTYGTGAPVILLYPRVHVAGRP
jgi:2-polyprenyl-3-methyl-5-hydroxy-6-metoxy-1,4-benzoquinol methylase